MQEEIQSNLTLRYMVAAIALSTVTIVAIVVVTAVRPEHDNSGIITTILAVSTATYPTLATFIRGQANSEELRRAKMIQDKKAAEVKAALEEAQRKLAESTRAQKEHLEAQDRTLEKVVKQTNGLIDKVAEAAHKAGHESGEKAALKELIEKGKIKELE